MASTASLGSFHTNLQINKFKAYGIAPPPPHYLTFAEVHQQLVSISPNGDCIDTNGKASPSLLHMDSCLYPHIMISSPPTVHLHPTHYTVAQPTSHKAHNSFWSFITNSLFSLFTNKEETNTSNTNDNGHQHSMNGAASSECAIIDLCWHPQKNKFAVALTNNNVYIYDMNLEVWESIVLSHGLQIDIKCIQWNEKGGNQLAVACGSGIALWTLQTHTSSSASSSSSTTPSLPGEKNITTAWVTWLTSAATKNATVTSLAWSPDGRYLASSSSSHSSSSSSPYLLTIWDVILQVPTQIDLEGILAKAVRTTMQFVRENFFGSSTKQTKDNDSSQQHTNSKCGITILKWSPNGNYLFVSTSCGVFFVFETLTWTYQRWNTGKVSPKTACWSGDGGILVVSLEGSSIFYSFSFSYVPPIINGSYIRGDDVSSYQIDNAESIQQEDSTLEETAQTTTIVGGEIKEISWDKKTQRFAVAFTGKPVLPPNTATTSTPTTAETNPFDGLHSDRTLIALFSTTTSPTLQFTPRGFIRGPPTGTQVEVMTFRPSFDRGALLTVCWLNGKVSFYPLYTSNM